MSPSHPFNVEPSNIDVQPVWSLKSMGSGCEKPWKAWPGAPRWTPCETPVAVEAGCCEDAGAARKSRIQATQHAAMVTIKTFVYLKFALPCVSKKLYRASSYIAPNKKMNMAIRTDGAGNLNVRLTFGSRNI